MQACCEALYPICSCAIRSLIMQSHLITSSRYIFRFGSTIPDLLFLWLCDHFLFLPSLYKLSYRVPSSLLPQVHLQVIIAMPFAIQSTKSYRLYCLLNPDACKSLSMSGFRTSAFFHCVIPPDPNSLVFPQPFSKCVFISRIPYMRTIFPVYHYLSYSLARTLHLDPLEAFLCRLAIYLSLRLSYPFFDLS